MMRFAHISDLHLGKRLNGTSLIDDQRYIVREITDIVKENGVDALLIAGDVFDDGSSMTAESMSLFDDMISGLSESGIDTFIISGNHDSMDKLNYASWSLKRNHIFISSDFKGRAERFEVTKDGDTVGIYMLPFIKPVHVRDVCGTEVSTFEEAVSTVLRSTELKDEKRILITHQYVVDGEQQPRIFDSERAYVGGTECISASLFDSFDYVALGHIHSCQSIGRDTVRYCGTPLKYSKSEVDDEKSITVIDIDDDGVKISAIPLIPLHDVKVVRGTLDEILAHGHDDDYIYIELLDENLNDTDRIRELFPNLMEIRRASVLDISLDEQFSSEDSVNILDEFVSFYRSMMGEDMSEAQKEKVIELFNENGVRI